MTASVAYRWDVDSFLRAHGAGAFRIRVELVDGEVWPVVLGFWHGRTTPRVVAALLGFGDVLQATLPSEDSLPDPDVWLLRPDARPTGEISPRLPCWSASDVLLVVEVSDETLQEDLTTKAALYARSGYGCYWVVTHDGVYEHVRPTPQGYLSVRLVDRDGTLPVPDSTHEISVAALLP